MARKRVKQSQMPVSGGTRRNKGYTPTIKGTGDSSVIGYNGQLQPLLVNTSGRGLNFRQYIGGFQEAFASGAIGPSIVARYSSCKFLPGTTIRWEPSVSFSTSGRVYVGFTDNPEVTAFMIDLAVVTAADPTNTVKWNNYESAVRALGSCISFPVWQETDIPFPTKLRRKRFDTNQFFPNIAPSINTLDRCCQTTMFAAVVGVNTTTALTVGNFHVHDKVDVEGITPTISNIDTSLVASATPGSSSVQNLGHSGGDAVVGLGRPLPLAIAGYNRPL